MTTKTTTFLLFFCLSNIPTYTMHKPPMEHIVNNLHENTKKPTMAPAHLYNYKQDPLRAKERQKTMFLKRERERKNKFHLPHNK